jgi:hypothetical protein
LKLHDRSGANVTASESPRLVPFILAIGDDPKTIRDKLGNFRREYEAALRDQYSVYGPGTGHRALAPVEEALKPRGGGGGGSAMSSADALKAARAKLGANASDDDVVNEAIRLRGGS